MRFPAIFEPRMPLHMGQPQGRVPAQQGSAPAPADDTRATAAAGVAEPPDDLDQRVRQTGEWQLEDW